jgi:antitoxin PrlF
MHSWAKMTSKGQLTVPKAVREALELEPGDRVFFEVERGRAALAKAPSFLDLAGSVEAPPEKRGMGWDEILREAHAAQAERAERRN